MKTRTSAVKKSISLPKGTLTLGLARSKQQSRSFSSYVQSLIMQDLSRSERNQARVQPKVEVVS
jgi:hypothetical protein